MRKPGHGRLTRRTAIATAATLAAVVAGGGYALASTNAPAPGPGPGGGNGVSLTYLVGAAVDVAPRMNGQSATMCPRGMYPVGGGLSSSRAYWEIQSSYADRSNRRAQSPDEWTVSVLNDSNSRARFQVYVVCSTAGSVNSNY
jgi:hypothetical protein